jgi:Peptidase A4 family
MACPSSSRTRPAAVALFGALAAALLSVGTAAAITPTSAATALAVVSTPAPVATTSVVFAPVAAAYGANSGTWAGWVAAGHHTSVSASWRQPSVTCAAHETSDSAFWVGLDGYGSRSVEQVGTQSGCSNGTPFYSAWTEFFPAPAASSSVPVRPGDSFRATVTFVSGHTYRLTLTNLSRNNASQTVTASSNLGTNGSVEVVVEAPTDARSGRVLALSRFSPARFTAVAVDNAPLSRLARRQQLVMGSAKRVMAQPSDVDSSQSFGVNWRAATG